MSPQLRIPAPDLRCPECRTDQERSIDYLFTHGHLEIDGPPIRAICWCGAELESRVDRHGAYAMQMVDDWNPARRALWDQGISLEDRRAIAKGRAQHRADVYTDDEGGQITNWAYGSRSGEMPEGVYEEWIERRRREREG